MEFATKIGRLTESEGLHQNINIGWEYSKLTLCNHKINGLTERDFIMDEKIEALK